MTNDEQNIFDAILNENADWAADAAEKAAVEAAAAATDKAKELPMKDNGVSYAGDYVNDKGHTLSRYAVRAEGKTLFFAEVNTSVEADAPALHYTGEQPITWHPIEVVSPKGDVRIATMGAAVKAPHGDGVHVDGQTVAAFVAPRVIRFMVQVYGI